MTHSKVIGWCISLGSHDYNIYDLRVYFEIPHSTYSQVFRGVPMNKNHPVPHVLLASGLGAWAGPLLLERLPSCIDTRPAGRMGTREEEDFGLTPNGRDQA